MFSQAVPFPDSLLSLAYMDVGTVEPIIRKLHDALWQLALTKDSQYQQSAYALLDELAPRHIYFQQFRLDWKHRLSRAMIFEQFTEDVNLEILVLSPNGHAARKTMMCSRITAGSIRSGLPG